MIDFLRDCIGFGCLAGGALGAAYALAAAVLMPRVRRHAPSAPSAHPGVTILKPVHGTEPALRDNLASFRDQDYPGPVQLLFGIEDESDPALAVVRALAKERPEIDLDVVLTRDARGANPKVSTLVALAPHVRHPTVVLADSDIAVPPDYLRSIVAALYAPGVGLVTCLYRGEARGGFWAVLAAMAIDYHFLPSVVVGVASRLARPCFGSTIALRAETLAAIGGFEAFVDHLADDHAMGEAVRRLGLAVAIPPLVVAHTCSESGLAELFGHELRWARTIRAIDPVGYAASVVVHAIPLALLALWLLGASALTASLLAAALACRLVLELRVDHTLGLTSRRWYLGPLRDLLSFAVYVASFFVAVVTWRGRRYRVRADGTLAAIAGSSK